MHHENLNLQFLGRYNDRKVYKGANSFEDAPDYESIYLVSRGKGRGYRMYINKKLVGHCDDDYAVEWFKEPEEETVEELTFTATPVAPQYTPEPAPVSVPESQPARDSDDFWTRIQKEITDVLNSAAI